MKAGVREQEEELEGERGGGGVEEMEA